MKMNSIVAKASRRNLVSVLGVGMVLCALAFGALVGYMGSSSTPAGAVTVTVVDAPAGVLGGVSASGGGGQGGSLVVGSVSIDGGGGNR